MKLKENIDQLNSDIQNIKSSITDKGVEIPDGTPLSEYGDKVTEVYKVGRDSVIDESKIIEKTVSGEYISVDDVSEIPHEVKVKLTSGGKNLWSRGDVTVLRMSTFSVKLLAGKTYTFSCIATSTDTDTKSCLVYDGTNGKNIGTLGRGYRSSVTYTPTNDMTGLYLYASDGYANSANDTATFKDIMLEQISGENLFDINDSTIEKKRRLSANAGTSWSNSAHGSDNFNVSHYVPVEGGKNYTAYNTNTGSSWYCWYDKDKVYISGGGTTPGKTLTAPSNACYFRFDYPTTDTNVTFCELFDPSPYEPYKETLTDYSGVSLTRCGGNLFDCLNSQPPSNTYGYAIITDRTENSITIQKSHSNGYEYAEFVLPNIQAGEKITVYAEWTCSGNNNGMIRVNWNSKLEPGDIITSSQKSGVSASGIIPEKPSNATHLSLLLYGGTSGETSAGLEVYYKNIMVNIGDKTIKFEPYNGQTLTANADGTVEGVKSTSPYMYMTTDNPNVTINATYHKSYGMQTEYDRFWDVFQDYGNRTEYPSAFQGVYWKDEIFKPKYLLQPTKAGSMFIRTGITDIRMVDLTKATDVGNLCNSSTQGIRYVGKIGNSSITTFGSVFGWCHKLISVEKMIVGANAQFATAFEGCYDLESITFEGTIAYNISFAGSSKLNKASILSVFNALSTTATGKTLTLSTTAVNNAFETSSGAADGSTSEEWTNLVATKTNWTISLV